MAVCGIDSIYKVFLQLSGVNCLHFNTHLFPYHKKKLHEGLCNSPQKQGRVLPWVFVLITHV